MYMAQPGHIDHIKQINAGRVYKLIDQYGPISRIDLSKLSGLAPASITKISRELMEGHLIRETIVQEAVSRGRPAVGLQTQNKGWQFLSIRLGKGYLIIALHELSGHVVIDQHITIKETEQEELLTRVLLEIETFFITYSNFVERMTSIAVTLPGLVDAENGIVIQMPHFNINNLALGPALFEATGVPVFIANDLCAWALAEMLFGHSQEVDNSLLVSNYQGVGAGVILAGRAVYSRFGNVGTLGHIQIDPNGLPCACGKNGCLDTVASSVAVCENAEQALANGASSRLVKGEVTMESICQAAVAGDELATQTIQTLGRHLGQAIAIMVNIFSPEKILLGGSLNQAKPILYPVIQEVLEQQSLPICHRGIQITESRYLTQTTMPGAALIKQALYDGKLLLKVVEG